MTISRLGRVGIVPKGTYDSETVYSRLDLVTSDGSSYLYIGTTPSAGASLSDATSWQLISRQPTIRVGTVTTGPTPNVINVGTEHDAVLDFVLPDTAYLLEQGG